MEWERHYDDEMVQDAENYKKRFLTAENVDNEYCNGCQHKFKELAEKEEECATCICTTLMNIS